MNYTLLKTVQLILSSMDSDEVNNIDDTVESRQVTDICETTFNDIVTSVDFPSHEGLIELTASGDTTRPTLMTLPDGVIRIDWVQYDNRLDGDTARNMVDVRPITKFDFLRQMNNLDTADTNIYQFDFLVGSQTFDIRGHNDAFPTFYTCLDNRQLIFNDYYASINQTLVGDKTLVHGRSVPVFTRSNSFIPNFDPRSFSLWFNESKAQAFLELKQAQNAKAEQRARRALVGSQHHKNRTPQETFRDTLPSYGRNRTTRPTR